MAGRLFVSLILPQESIGDEAPKNRLLEAPRDENTACQEGKYGIHDGNTACQEGKYGIHVLRRPRKVGNTEYATTQRADSVASVVARFFSMPERVGPPRFFF